MKETSKREKKKLEKMKQENIEKFDEAYQRSRIIPDEYKGKIRKRILKNTLIAVIIIAYLIGINLLSLNIETKTYILGIKVICIILAIISVTFFELSYRKDDGYLFLYGAEFLTIAVVSLFSIYAYIIFFDTYNNILAVILAVIAIYYLIKTIITIMNMKKQYYKEQNDIKDIVKK